MARADRVEVLRPQLPEDKPGRVTALGSGVTAAVLAAVAALVAYLSAPARCSEGSTPFFDPRSLVLTGSVTVLLAAAATAASALPHRTHRAAAALAVVLLVGAGRCLLVAVVRGLHGPSTDSCLSF